MIRGVETFTSTPHASVNSHSLFGWFTRATVRGTPWGAASGVGFLLEYPAQTTSLPTPARTVRRSEPSSARPVGSRPLRGGFIGAGNYAASMLLPHLAKHPEVDLVSVATTRSLSAVNAQRKFGFATASTDSETVLTDPSVDLVFVVTRHHNHADFVCAALERGKTVFVEKPLALTQDQLDRVGETIARTGNDRLMVGFNRRFAPLFVDLQRRFGERGGPISARYLVNAGPLDAGSWYLDSELEGSRFLGEGGHFIDTLVALTGSVPTEVWARQTPGGLAVHISIRFADGSLGEITYATDGHAKVPKETLDVSGRGRSARLDDFARATVWGGRGKSVRRGLTGPDKGQATQLDKLVAAARCGGPMPILLEQLLATTRATIAVQESLVSGKAVVL